MVKEVFKGICSVMLVAMVALTFNGCATEEPQRAEGIIVPDGPRDPGNGNSPDHTPDQDNNNDSQTDDNTPGNNGTGENQPDTDDAEDSPAIAGEWKHTGSEGLIFFDKEGQFIAYNCPAMGFHKAEEEYAEGTYTYSDFKNFLWITVQADETIYVLEFNCILSDNEMILYPMTGPSIKFIRK